jgi:hypothetical protein
MLEVLGIKNAAKLVPTDDDRTPQDPVSENMNVINLKPVKAFLYQDHEAHIRVHMAAMQDPLIQQLAGQNPQAPMIQQAMQAHIMEHIAFAYRQKIEQALGADLPKPDEKMAPAVEIQLSRLVAQAAPIVLQNSQSQVAQQQAQAAAQQAAQDPVIQMQQQELALKKEKQDSDAAIAQAKLKLEEERLQADIMLRGMQTAAKSTIDYERMIADNEREGVRIGADIADKRANRARNNRESE